MASSISPPQQPQPRYTHHKMPQDSPLTRFSAPTTVPPGSSSDALCVQRGGEDAHEHQVTAVTAAVPPSQPAAASTEASAATPAAIPGRGAKESAAPEVVPIAAAVAASPQPALSPTAAAATASTTIAGPLASRVACGATVLTELASASITSQRVPSTPLCLEREESASLPALLSTVSDATAHGTLSPTATIGATPRFTETSEPAAKTTLRGGGALREAASEGCNVSAGVVHKECPAARSARLVAQVSRSDSWVGETRRARTDSETTNVADPFLSCLPTPDCIRAHTAAASGALGVSAADRTLSPRPGHSPVRSACSSPTSRSPSSFRAASMSGTVECPPASRAVRDATRASATVCPAAPALACRITSSAVLPMIEDDGCNRVRSFTPQTSATAPAPAICASTARTLPVATSAGSVQNARASNACVCANAAFAGSVCGADEVTSPGTRQGVRHSGTAVAHARSPQQPASGAAVRSAAPSLSRTVVSLSITVINDSLETPLRGVDHLIAPFSGKRITRVPVIRIYGIINEAFVQHRPTTSQSHCTRSTLSPWLHCSSTGSSDRRSNSRGSNAFCTDPNRSITRPLSVQNVGSRRDRSSISIRGPGDLGSSRNGHADAKMYGARSSDLAYDATSQSCPPGGSYVLRSDNVPTSSTRTVDREPLGAQSDTAGTASRECFFRSLLGPPTAYSAVVRKLNTRGALVRSLDSLKGRSCCAAVHGVLPYFFVPLPLEGHAHPRQWLRWFCCRLREAEQQLQPQLSPAAGSAGHVSSSSLQQHVDGDGSRAGADACIREVDSFTRPQHHQQEKTYSDPDSRVHKRRSLSPNDRDHDILIYDVRLVWRRSIYGYDHVPRLFAQIFTLLPGIQTRRLAGMLLQGSVTGQPLQPFEVHIPYTVHFLADYTLRGTDMLVVCNPLFVAPVVLSPEQACTDRELLLPIARPLTAHETASGLRRHTTSGTLFSTGRDASETQAMKTTVLCEPGTGTAGSGTPALLTQPPAGVLLFRSWRELWQRLNRAAVEITAAASATHSTTLHEADAAACAVSAGRLLPALHATAPEGSSSDSCVDDAAEAHTGLREGDTLSDDTCASSCSAPFPTSTQSGALRTYRNGTSVSFHRSCSAPTVGRSDAAAFVTSSAHCRKGTSNMHGISASINNRRSTKGQHSSSSSTCTRRHISVGIWTADGNWVKESRGVGPYFPASKRRTSCETEFHVHTSQIINPYLEGATEASSELQYHGLYQAVSHETATFLPQEPLLAAVRDYWQEEAVRAAALGLRFPSQEYPVKLAPPPTLPSTAVAALEQRQRCPAQDAVPQAYKHLLRQLLTRAGVLRSESRRQNDAHECPTHEAQHLRQQHQVQCHPQLCPPHQPRFEEDQLRGEGHDDTAACRAKDFRCSSLKEGGVPKKKCGASIATARHMEPHQPAQNDSTLALQRAKGPSSRDDANAAAPSLGQDAEADLMGSSVWSVKGAAKADPSCSVALPCAEEQNAASAEYRDGKHTARASRPARRTPATEEGSDCYLLTLSQEAPSPSGTWTIRRQQTQQPDHQWRSSLDWLSCEQAPSLPPAARDACVQHPPGTDEYPHGFRGGDGATASSSLFSVRQHSSAAVLSDGRTAPAAAANAAAALAATGASASVPLHDSAHCACPAAAKCSGPQQEDYATADSLRTDITTRSCNNASVSDTQRATSATDRGTDCQHSDLLYAMEEVSTIVGSARCSLAVAQQQASSVGLCEGIARAETVDKAHPLCPHDSPWDSGTSFLSRAASSVAAGGKCHHCRKPSSEQLESSGTSCAVEWLQISSPSPPRGDSSVEGEKRKVDEELALRLTELVNRRRKHRRSTTTRGVGAVPAAEGASVRSSTNSGYGAGGNCNSSTASPEHITNSETDDKVRLLEQTNRWSSQRLLRKSAGRNSAAVLVSHEKNQRRQQPHVQHAWHEPRAPQQRAAGLSPAPKQLISRQNQQIQFQVSTHDGVQQSATVDVDGHEQLEAPVVGKACKAEFQKSQKGDQDSAGESKRREENRAAALKAAATGQSGASTGAAGGEVPLGEVTTRATKAVTVRTASGVHAGAQVRRPPKRSETTETHGESHALDRGFTSFACKVIATEQGGRENSDSCLESKSSFLSDGSTIVLSNDEYSQKGRPSLCTGEGTVMTDQREGASNRKSLASQQRGQHDQRRREKNIMLTDSAGVTDKVEAVSVQDQTEELCVAFDGKPPHAESLPSMISVVSALQRQCRRSTVKRDQPVSSGERPSSGNPHPVVSSGYTLQLPHKGQQRENMQQEQRQERVTLRHRFGKEVVVDGWPDVPVQLPFYGDHRDSPLHSLRSAVVAAHEYSSTKDERGQRQTRDILERQECKTSREQQGRGPAAASFEQQGPKVRRRILVQQARHRKISKTQEARQSQHFSEASSTATMDSPDLFSADGVAQHSLLDKPTIQANRQEPQHQQLPNWQHHSYVGVVSEGAHVERCLYKMDSNAPDAHLSPESAVQACDHCVTPVREQTHQTISLRDEFSVGATVRQSSRCKTSEGVDGSQSDKEEWPAVQLLTWRFCRPPPSRHLVFVTCPPNINRLSERHAGLAWRRQQLRRVVAYNTRRRRSAAVLTCLYSARRQLNCGTTFAGSKRSGRTKDIRWAKPRRHGNTLLISAFPSPKRQCQNSASQASVSSSFHDLHVRRVKVLKVSVDRGSCAAKRVGQSGNLTRVRKQHDRKVSAELRGTSTVSLTVQDTRQCTNTGQRLQEMFFPTAGFTTATELRPGSGDAGAGGETTGRTRSFLKKGGFRRKLSISCETSPTPLQAESSESGGRHPLCQRATLLYKEHRTLATPAGAAWIHRHPKPHLGSQLTRAPNSSWQACQDVSAAPLEREILIEQASSGVAGTNRAGAKSRSGAVPVDGTGKMRMCACNLCSCRAVRRRSATTSTARTAAAPATPASTTASALEKPPAIAARDDAGSAGRDFHPISTSEGTNFTEDGNASPTLTSHSVQQPLCDRAASSSRGSWLDGHVLYHKHDRHLPIDNCRLHSTSVARAENFITAPSAHAGAVSCVAIRNAEGNEDDAARGVGGSQLSGGVDTFNTSAMSGAAREVEATADNEETEADGARAALAATLAVSDYQGRGLLYGSLVAVEVLAEREGCSERVPEGLGASTPWKDAVLAVAFAVRDERLRVACEEIRKRITLRKGIQLPRQQTVHDASEAAQCQSDSRAQVSNTHAAEGHHGTRVPASPGGIEKPNTARHVCVSEKKFVCGRKGMPRNAATDFFEKNNGDKAPILEEFQNGSASSTKETDATVAYAQRGGRDSGVRVAYGGDKYATNWHCTQLKGREPEVLPDSKKEPIVELFHVEDAFTCASHVSKNRTFPDKGYFVRKRAHQTISRGNCGACGRKASSGTGAVKEREALREGRTREEEPMKASLHDLPTYNEALAVVFVDQPYVARRVLSTLHTCSTEKVVGRVSFEDSHRRQGQDVGLPAGASLQAAWSAEFSAKDCSEAPFPRSFADFAVHWQRRHPPLDAHAQLKHYLPWNTQLFAVKNEHELLRKTAVLLTLLDPSFVLQWDGSNGGLGYLLRRAAVLGCDREFCLALSRRVDRGLLPHVSWRCAPLPGSAGERLPKKGYESRGNTHTGGAPSAKQRRYTRGRIHKGRVCRLPQEESKLSARILLNCWRVLQQELKLQQSTLEGVVQHVLGVTLPTIPVAVLLNLWKQGQQAQRRAERRDERMMVSAWKLWERRRIRFRWPVSCLPHAGVRSSQQFQYEKQKLLRRRERLYQGWEEGQQGRARQTEPQSSEQYKAETAYQEGSDTVDSCPQVYLDGPTAHLSGDLGSADSTWGVASMGAVLKYLLGRLQALLALVDSVGILPRTAELARLYGCDFHSALLRGSQFKVESVMLRATKLLGYVFASPSQKQVTEQTAPMCIPLVLEPHSGFYWSPVLVLDFQSLYPSIMIANNICFSTSLGSVEVDPTIQPTKAFGVLDLHLPARVFQQISLVHRRFTGQQTPGWNNARDVDLPLLHAQVAAWSNSEFPCRCHLTMDTWCSRERGGFGVQQVDDTEESGVNVLPNGSMFVSPKVRQGVFPRVLWDLLRTRVMIKKLMNLYRECGNQRVVQLLDHRQHGLKMITNVSYGYTAASFTGHMPCAEVADAIVQTARTTLMRAIQLVENTSRWGGRVLYGDTDSLFVLVEKKSLEAAFEIGREIAYAVTQQNPPPVELQLEKVFLPCCLISKKRYVGYAYTAPCAKPYLDAKGIESVRRDQCGCTSTVLESTLRTFFTTRDLSCVKRHLRRQWTKILRGDISLKQFIFFRKCRLGLYKAESEAAASGSLPPQAKVAYERMYAVAEICDVRNVDASPAVASAAQAFSLASLQDRAPTRGERVPFVYAATKAGNSATKGGKSEGSPAKQTSCVRLLDFAVSPDKVEGGGRGEMWMHTFCHGAPQLMLRNVFPRKVDGKPRNGMGGSHAGKAYWSCSGADGGKRSSDVEDAFFIRGYVESHLSQRAPQESAIFTDIGRDLKVKSGRLPLEGARKERAICCIGISKGERRYEETLLPLYSRYYIVKQIIPALERLFCLLPPPNTVDLSHWYKSLPRVRRTSSLRLHGHPRLCSGSRRVHDVQRRLPRLAARLSDCGQGRLNEWRQGLVGNGGRQLQWVSPCGVPHSAQVTTQLENGAGQQFGSMDVLPRCWPLPESHGSGMQPHLLHRLGNTGVKSGGKDEIHGDYTNACHDGLHVLRGSSLPRSTQETALHPVCGDGSINALVAIGLTNELKTAEKQFLEMEALCEACAGSKICGAACSHAWHCDVYFLKLRNEKKISELLSRMHAVLED